MSVVRPLPILALGLVGEEGSGWTLERLEGQEASKAPPNCGQAAAHQCPHGW